MFIIQAKEMIQFRLIIIHYALKVCHVSIVTQLSIILFKECIRYTETRHVHISGLVTL